MGREVKPVDSVRGTAAGQPDLMDSKAGAFDLSAVIHFFGFMISITKLTANVF